MQLLQDPAVPTFNELGLVDAPHALQDAVVEGLGQLGRHGCVEVWLVGFQDALQGELAHTQHLIVQVHDAFAPRSAILVLKEPQVQDLLYPGNMDGRAGRTLIISRIDLLVYVACQSSNSLCGDAVEDFKSWLVIDSHPNIMDAVTV